MKTKKRGRGRPEKEEKKELFPSFRMWQKQIDAIKDQAEEKGQSVGQYVANHLENTLLK